MYYPLLCARYRKHLHHQCLAHYHLRDLPVSATVASSSLPLVAVVFVRSAYTIHFNSASSFVILFIEVPFLLRICPTSSKFDDFIRRFTTNWMRAAIYIVLSGIQWASLATGACSLIAAAVFLVIASLFYALAAAKSQEFVGSKTLGGAGVAQMIV